MDQFMYVADPKYALRMHNSAHLEDVKRKEWTRARHIEELQRSRAAERKSVLDVLQSPRARERNPWLSWRGVLRSFRLAGSVR